MKHTDVVRLQSWAIQLELAFVVLGEVPVKPWRDWGPKRSGTTELRLALHFMEMHVVGSA